MILVIFVCAKASTCKLDLLCHIVYYCIVNNIDTQLCKKRCIFVELPMKPLLGACLIWSELITAANKVTHHHWLPWLVLRSDVPEIVLHSVSIALDMRYQLSNGPEDMTHPFVCCVGGFQLLQHKPQLLRLHHNVDPELLLTRLAYMSWPSVTQLNQLMQAAHLNTLNIKRLHQLHLLLLQDIYTKQPLSS